MDGVEVETLWGDFEEEVSTGGVEVGDTAWNYVFASVDTTGSSAALSYCTQFDPSTMHR